MHKTTETAQAPVAISPAKYDAVIFDLDGVVTKTAKVHAGAWKQVFDAFLQEQQGSRFQPFDMESDYHLYVDGKPRYEGVQSFLQSRGIELPWGNPDDPPGFSTICALGNTKNQAFLKQLQEQGVEPYQSTIGLIRHVKNQGLKTAIITASKNGSAVLEAAHLLSLFDAKIDGVDAVRLQLKGKPEPDVFLAAASQLGVEPARAVVVEDAIAGVEAGKKGGFGLVIGVNRDQQASRLQQSGADIVVGDLAEINTGSSPDGKLPELATADLGKNLEYWVLEYTEFSPETEKRHEALCTLGNGYFATRGAAPESCADEVHYPGTYLAGGYNRLETDIAGHTLPHEDLVNLPNWLVLRFRIDQGEWFDLRSVEILSYRQALDLRQGILYRDIRFRDSRGRETSLAERRFVHMRHFHLGGLESRITAHNWSGRLTVHSALDGRISNNGARQYRFLNKKHLEPLETGIEDHTILLAMQTTQSRLEIAQAARTRVFRNGETPKAVLRNIQEPDYVALEISLPISQGDCVSVEKIAALYTSRDNAISEAGLAARNAVTNAPGFDSLINDQITTWQHLWQRFDLDLETRENHTTLLPSLVLHLHIFHVLQTASQHSIDLDIGIPARGWSGEAYQGHIFWDDLFVFPFLNLRMPKITQALLRYRYRRLDAARQMASEMGAKGARYPWQSGSSGREETPKYYWDPDAQVWWPDYTYRQLHVGSAVAYNIWQYYQATDDLEFMFSQGMEMFLEIARFWGSVAEYNPDRQRYEIKHVVGPDEYHVRYPDTEIIGIHNNAYTNIMATWVLCRAQELVAMLPEDYRDEIYERLHLSEAEIELWDRISRNLVIPFHEDGVISQFEGYGDLEEFPWRQQDGKIDLEHLKQLLKEQGGQLPQYKVSKQADVLMLFYLFSAEELQELFERLGYSFEYTTIPKNVAYYNRHTAHGSTLSRVAHAWVLSRMDRAHAWELFSSLGPSSQHLPAPASILPSWEVFLEALGSDFFDIQGGTTPEGIHLGAMAGTVDIIQRCYTGIVTGSDALWLNPRLPEALLRLSFNLHYRNQSLRFEITQEQITVMARYSGAKPIKIGFQDRIYELSAGETRTFDIQSLERRRQEKRQSASP